MENLISIKKFDPKINEDFRTFIGQLISEEARKQKIEYIKKKNENHYPNEFLNQYFRENPISYENENCEKITVEMIKLLPIRMFTNKYVEDQLTTDGSYIFHKTRMVGKWKT
ncbi:hypothetical protein [Flavobacterium sp.]|uniref:hypothetical protein n=1 Tax=Flavobacterium sp. TaxID=239 RepID=UPI003753376A